MPASLNFALPASVTTTPRFFGSRWFASESRNTCLDPVQHFVRWTSISIVTGSLIRPMASTGDKFISYSSINHKGDPARRRPHAPAAFPVAGKRGGPRMGAARLAVPTLTRPAKPSPAPPLQAQPAHPPLTPPEGGQ